MITISQFIRFHSVLYSIHYRLYSCLANGSADEYLKGEQLYKAGAVKDALQIGKLVVHSCNSTVAS